MVCAVVLMIIILKNSSRQCDVMSGIRGGYSSQSQGPKDMEWIGKECGRKGIGKKEGG